MRSVAAAQREHEAAEEARGDADHRDDAWDEVGERHEDDAGDELREAFGFASKPACRQIRQVAKFLA